MTELQTIVTVVVIVGLVVVLVLDWLDMAVAGLMAVSGLIVCGALTREDVREVVDASDGVLALLFGGMVVARTLAPTGIFEWVGVRFLLATRGSGKRFFLGLLLLIAPVCAFLPNATAVVLLAPVIIRVARDLEMDFVGPMVLTAIVSNSAGMLTLVGDPATFVVGSAMGMTFGEFLKRVSLGGLLTLLVLIPLLPRLVPDGWTVRRTLPAGLRTPPLKQPVLGMLALGLLGVMVLLFLFGELLPTPIVPPAVAILACAGALLLVHAVRVEPVQRVLADIDWRTLIFILSMFVVVQAVIKAGFLQRVGDDLYHHVGVNRLAVSVVLMAGLACLSSILPNIPVVAASTLMIKGYFVITHVVPEEALGVGFTDWPVSTLPIFVAMMFGGTLGGNATLIGASANLVSGGICAAHGKPVGFLAFLRYGLPVAATQLAVGALYVTLLYLTS